MEQIAISTPVDRVARWVTSEGYKYSPDKKPNGAFWDICPPLKEPMPNAPNFAGVKFGRFTVIGLSRTFKARWVVRCSCGRFEVRRAKAIKNPRNSGDACDHCRHLEYLKRTDFYRRNGFDMEERP